MRVLTQGYTIPLTSRPPRFHRPANGPDLAEHKDAAWAALKKDIAHGAVVPCNVAVSTLAPCHALLRGTTTCLTFPVRTSDTFNLHRTHAGPRSATSGITGADRA